MKEKVAKTIGIIMTAILTFVLIACILGFIVLPVITFIIIMIPDFFFLLSLSRNLKKKRFTALCVRGIIYAVLLAFHILFWGAFHMPVSAYTSWQYPLALKYAEFPGSDSFLPRELPSSARHVRFDFMPTILQGDGHIAVGFYADDEYVKNLENELKGSAMHVVNYNELGNLNNSFKNGEIIHLYDSGISHDHPDAKVYILYTDYDWNHPSSKAVFVDGDYVFFSQE